jgi:hypothetical protein
MGGVPIPSQIPQVLVAYAANYSAVNQAGWPPLFDASPLSVGIIYIAVSYILLATVPKAAELIKAFIQGRGFAFESAIGESFAGAQWAQKRLAGRRKAGSQAAEAGRQAAQRAESAVPE